ncbi:MAG: DUF4105 domain-containing protein [Patescibacteria group bacterium]
MWNLIKWAVIVVFLGSIFAYGLIHLIIRPSHDRDWSEDQALLPYAEITGDQVFIHNIRNFTYASTTSYTAHYYDKKFDLSKLKKVYYVVEPFSGFAGAAHTFLSFEFDGYQFMAISVEIRKEKGETFSALKGLFNQYELMYVIADERDVIKLRSNYRKDDVFVYPIRTTPEKARALFLDMIARANGIKEKPEFYNTLTNTCTTNIVSHVNKISPKRVPFSLKVLFPAHSDELAYKLGLIDTDLSFDEARMRYKINDRALKYADDPNFSVKIREITQ